MNVFGKRERSWRKARKRGVSPIIATILLVAITVVLAAVLYVLISGLTHGTGSAPLGTNFGWGTPQNITGSVAPGCTSAAVYCYSLEISAGGSLTTGNFYLGLRSPSGATIAWPTITSISMVSPSSVTVLTTYTVTANVPGTSWVSSSVLLASGDTIVVQTTAVGAGHGLFGDQMVAIASSGYSGTVPSNTIF
jgi:archaeal type IV pilus assembly protein PilA